MKQRPHTAIRKTGAAVLATLWLLAALIPGAVRGADREYEIKAAFLLNFTRYIESRPGHAVRKSGQPSELAICVAGPDVFGSALDNIAANKTVNGQRIVIRKTPTAVDASICDMVYISWTNAKEIRDALKTLESSAIVTVGEDSQFLRMGGMIAFTESEGKVRFYINQAAAERAGIVISSRLMMLAKNIRDESERRR